MVSRARSVDLGERVDVVAPAALCEVRLHHQLRERRGAEVGGLLPRLIFSSTGGGATTQPSLILGERILEKVPRYMV